MRWDVGTSFLSDVTFKCIESKHRLHDVRLVLSSRVLINVIRKCAVSRLSLPCSMVFGCVVIS